MRNGSGVLIAVIARRPGFEARLPADRFKLVTAVAAFAIPALVLLILILIGGKSWPAITHFGPGFLISRQWDPNRLQFGALPFIWGTLATSAIALLLAIPIGVGVALFLAEQGAARIRGAIGIGVELLAAIPSVVYGIWGLYILAPWLLLHVSQPVSKSLGWLAPFMGPTNQFSVFTASIVLAVMVLPTMASVSREVIKAVPSNLREASFALGATWWETTWEVILVVARPGILGATVLALGRALGETIAVTMTIGNATNVPTPLFAPAYSIASLIANEFTDAQGQGVLYPAAILELALVLMVITLLVNFLALRLVRRVSRDGAPAR